MTFNKKGSILIVEDEQSMREVLSMLLEEEGYEVTTAGDGLQGIRHIREGIFDLIVTDIKMPGAGGFEVLAVAKENSPGTPVIMITAFGTVESAIEAMKLGAYDYINKPFKIDEIRVIVRNAIDRQRLKEEVSILKERVKSTFEVKSIIGRSAPMQELLRLIHRVGNNESNVLITGESGTGKELVATAIHELSPRAKGNFVAINCAAFPEGLLESEIFGHIRGAFTGAVQNKRGLFEVADGGTLFLDEIGEMSVNLQSKLLRAIENSTFRRVGGTEDIKVNTRVISATNKDLMAESQRGNFREDLYYRLNVIPLKLPPLRERAEDIPVLVEHFCRKYSDGKRQFSGNALSALMRNEWKGNVRELENMIERILLFSDTDIITAQDLPPELTCERAVEADAHDNVEIGVGFDLEGLLVNIEKGYLQRALQRTGGNKTEAAKLLGLSFRSFRHKLSKYDM